MDTVVEYGERGFPEPFGVPAGVTRVVIEAQGASGGARGWGTNTSPGGSGMVVRGTLAVVPGQVLTVTAGQGSWGFASGGGGGGFGGGATGVSTGPAVLLVGGGGGGSGAQGDRYPGTRGGDAYLGTPGPSNDGESVPGQNARRGGRAGVAVCGSAAVTPVSVKWGSGGSGGGGDDPVTGLGCGEAGENGPAAEVGVGAGGGGGASYLALSLTDRSSALAGDTNGKVTIRFTGPAGAAPQRFAFKPTPSPGGIHPSSPDPTPATYTVPDQATLLHVKATGGAGESTLVPVKGGQVVELDPLCRAASPYSSALWIYPLWGDLRPWTGAGYASSTCYDPKTAGTVPPLGMTTPLWRLVNAGVDHLFTTSTTERNNLVPDGGWATEGVAAYVAAEARGDLVPLYRLFLPSTADHLLTNNPAERDQLTRSGWSLDGIVGYVAPTARAGLVALYRLYNQAAKHHHATAFTFERDQLTRSGWVLEGPIGYVVAS